MTRDDRDPGVARPDLETGLDPDPGDRGSETGTDEAVTAREQLERPTLDERLEEEEKEAERREPGDEPRPRIDLVEEDRPDHEPELVSSAVRGDEPESDRDRAEMAEAPAEEVAAEAPEPAAEETAMRVQEEAPGATEDRSDDYVAEDEVP